jgi:hypothetical protein
MLSFETYMRHPIARLLYLLASTVSLCFLGCKGKPAPITNGTVTLTLNPTWTAAHNPDGHPSLDRHSFKTQLMSWMPHPDGMSIRTHTECLSNEDEIKVRQHMTHSLFRARESSAVWFNVTTQSKPLSCIARESFPSKDLPTDTMLCYSVDGVSAVFLGRTFVQPEAIQILQSIKSNIQCTTK